MLPLDLEVAGGIEDARPTVRDEGMLGWLGGRWNDGCDTAIGGEWGDGIDTAWRRFVKVGRI